MPDIDLRVSQGVTILDGAMATMLQDYGLGIDGSTNAYNLEEPEIVEQIHTLYVQAGADVTITNTFCSTRNQLKNYHLADNIEEINRAGVRLARKANPQHVLGDVGSCGLFMYPMGTATFDDLYDQYYEQVTYLAKENPDGIIIETMTDIGDARAAFIASRDACDLPIFVSCSFEQNGRMALSGTKPEAVAVLFEKLGAFSVGVNCSLGPDLLVPIVESMAKFTSLPVLVEPNAGMPKTKPGTHEVYYPCTAEEMADWAKKLYNAGAGLIGTCCGSTPSFTALLKTDFFGKENPPRVLDEDARGLLLVSARDVLKIGPEKDVVYFANADSATDEADVLTINAYNANDEASELASLAQRYAGSPLAIDSMNPKAMGAALKEYPGRALINSISGRTSEEDKQALFKLAKKYGSAVVLLAITKDTFDLTADKKIAVLKALKEEALKAGLKEDDLLYDPAVLSDVKYPHAKEETLKATKILADAGEPVLLGIANASYELEDRDAADKDFANWAIQAGASAIFVR